MEVTEKVRDKFVRMRGMGRGMQPIAQRNDHVRMVAGIASAICYRKRWKIYRNATSGSFPNQTTGPDQQHSGGQTMLFRANEFGGCRDTEGGGLANSW
jgi:hypothetical protein